MYRFGVATLIGVLVLAMAVIGLTATGYVDAFSLVVRAADFQGALRRVADGTVVDATERLARVPMVRGSVRARIYAPVSGAPRHTALLVSGLHPAGIDEPRLMKFARELARTGVTVVTPDIPGLSEFEISTKLTNSIEHAAIWLAKDSQLAPTGRVGLIGISFSGGLAVVAAGRPSLQHHVSYVVSVGGHADLPRVLEYLCSWVEPQRGTSGGSSSDAEEGRRPHDYGLALLLLGLADRLVPADQVDVLRSLVRRFLQASYLDRVDNRQAAREFASIGAAAKAIPEPSATLIGHLNRRDVVELGLILLPYLGSYGNDPGLSPSRSPKPTAPVFLLHGRNDTVIPASESASLADDLRGRAPTRLLVTDLISHVAVDQPARMDDVLGLIAFWRDVLAHGSQQRTGTGRPGEDRSVFRHFVPAPKNWRRALDAAVL
jgi:dienelactone hydrolase